MAGLIRQHNLLLGPGLARQDTGPFAHLQHGDGTAGRWGSRTPWPIVRLAMGSRWLLAQGGATGQNIYSQLKKSPLNKCSWFWGWAYLANATLQQVGNDPGSVT